LHENTLELRPIKAMASVEAVFNDKGFIESEKRNAATGSVEAISPLILSAEDFHSRFVFSSHRSQLFAGFKEWLNVVYSQQIKIMSFWFGGSFIEKKEMPSDIDGLVFYVDEHNLGHKPECLQTDYCKKNYAVDLRAVSLKQNPVNVIHQAAQYTLYYSQPSHAKHGSLEPYNRRAIISILGPEVLKFLKNQRKDFTK